MTVGGRRLILVAVGDHERVVDELAAALTRSPGDREQIERTLMDGYAHALSLEAERFRAQNRVSTLAATIEQGDTAEKAKELSYLARQIDVQDALLSELRRLLAQLRAEHAAM